MHRCFSPAHTKVSEHWTQPPKHFTEDTLLAEMERPGSSEMEADVERKGLGTPATRASIIDKLIQSGYAVRKKKQVIATDAGKQLVSVLPEYLKSAKMTAETESKPADAEKSEATRAGTIILEKVDVEPQKTGGAARPAPSKDVSQPARRKESVLGRLGEKQRQIKAAERAELFHDRRQDEQYAAERTGSSENGQKTPESCLLPSSVIVGTLIGHSSEVFLINRSSDARNS